MQALRQEQDRLQKRLNQIYDDKLDGLIDEKMYLERIATYKSRQRELVDLIGAMSKRITIFIS